MLVSKIEQELQRKTNNYSSLIPVRTFPNPIYLLIADDEDDGGEGETVINVVEAHKLQEMQLSKKDTMAMLKAFLKKVVGYLKENGKEDRVPEFQKGATEMVKFIMGRFDEFQIFAGQSMDTEASLAFAYTKDGEENPTFLFFNDAMK